MSQRFKPIRNAFFLTTILFSISPVVGKAEKSSVPCIRVGQAMKNKGDLEGAINNYKVCLLDAVESNNHSTKAVLYFELAEVYRQMEKMEESMKALLLSMQEFRAMNSDSGKAAVHEAVALIHKRQNQPELALKPLLESIAYKERKNDTLGLANSFNLIGGVYAQLDSLELAAEFFLKSASEWEKIGHKINLAACLNNLANAYSALGRKKEAEQLYLQSIRIREKIENPPGLANSYNNLGDFYYGQNQFDKALPYFEKSARISDSLGAKGSLVVALENQSITYEIMGDYKEALRLLWQCDSIRELLTKEKYSRNVVELQEQFESEKKDYQIADLEKENQLKVLALEQERSQRIIWTLGSGLLLVALGFTLFLIAQHRRKNKEIEQQRKQVVQTNAELREITNTRDRLFAIIAHNLRGPLSALEGISGVMIHYVKNGQTEKLKRTVAEIDNTAFQTNALVENLLSWAGVKSRSIPYRPQELDLEGILQQSIELVAIQSEMKNIEVKLMMSGEYYIQADMNVIKTIMTNLLHNAIKFTPRLGRIEVVAKSLQERIQIEVRDQGVGIAPERLDSLFKASASKSTLGTAGEPGTGLGLYVCREFVRMEGGEIEVESIPGQGSTFRFTLAKSPIPEESHVTNHPPETN